MVYLRGLPDHKMTNDKMVDHLVTLVEEKASEIEAVRAAEEARLLAGD